MLNKVKSYTWIIFLFFILGLLQRTTAYQAAVERKLNQNLYDVVLMKCPILSMINVTEKAMMIEQCNNWTEINETSRFSSDTLQNVQCLLYYESLIKFCTALEDESLNYPMLFNFNISQLNFDKICFGSHSIQLDAKSFNHKVLHRIENQADCMVLCMDPMTRVEPAAMCRYAYYYLTFNTSMLLNGNKQKKNNESTKLNWTKIAEKYDTTNVETPIPNGSQIPQSSQENKLIINPEITEKSIIRSFPIAEPTKEQISNVNKPAAKLINDVNQIQPKDTIRIAPGVNTVKEDKTEVKNEVQPNQTKPNQTIDKVAVKDQNIEQNNVADLVPPALPMSPSQLPNQTKKIEVINVETDGEKQLNQPHSVKNAELNNDAAMPNPIDNELNNMSELEEEQEFSENMDDPIPISDKDNLPVKKPVKPKTVENAAESSYTSNDIDEADNDMEGNSYFFFYFTILICLVIVSYIGYYNRQKVVALMLEGKRGRRQTRTRRPNSANYHKLDSNLEEAISSSCNKPSSNVIY